MKMQEFGISVVASEFNNLCTPLPKEKKPAHSNSDSETSEYLHGDSDGDDTESDEPQPLAIVVLLMFFDMHSHVFSDDLLFNICSCLYMHHTDMFFFI